jgi:hypothetical protein
MFYSKFAREAIIYGFKFEPMHVAQLLWFLLILTKETNFASKLFNVLFPYK